MKAHKHGRIWWVTNAPFAAANSNTWIRTTVSLSKIRVPPSDLESVLRGQICVRISFRVRYGNRTGYVHPNVISPSETQLRTSPCTGQANAQLYIVSRAEHSTENVCHSTGVIIMSLTQVVITRVRKSAKSVYQCHARPSVHMYQRGSHWMDFREIWLLKAFPCNT
jgi:hypothetical protein